MSTLHTWATTWHVPLAAVQDLQRRLGMINTDPPVTPTVARSEAAVSNAVRMAASRQGWRVFRNNVGALVDARGVPLRFGLANDTAALNAALKSADLIGLRPVVIGPEHVGTTIGQFVSLEVKEHGWQFSGTKRELAQQRWAELVVSLGGHACFISHEDQL